MPEDVGATVYVSVTGLRLKRFWHVPLFWRHAIPCFSGARQAAGNMVAQTRTINGVHHTLTVWRDRAAMLAYVRSGAHAKAMKVFPKIATGRVYGGERKNPPDWEEALRLWTEHGRDV